ncbi:FAD dependent oxidoreductase-domain-containing protein [Abortiporus biennis]|nr:FAD dependent oxidoreductase-domain-containing protein [Abortiporus biennis]KAI0791679.1 FAD dependent oxidoreductase-domain-containing protein [Abortiporus biennis]KAI0791683.1 FAD dependent oxidoreductase-domain-containing protein [Abortiporus biennis]
MGNIVSRAKLVLAAAFYLNSVLYNLGKRLKESPGLPVLNPTQPFWSIPRSRISSEGKDLRKHADIVIIGSGITGTSIAYNLLKCEGKLRIVILEARDVCSGATARNGGHINPPLYQDYQGLVKKYGEKTAKTILRFRLSHLPELLNISKEEDLLKESQCREVEHFDVYFNRDGYNEAKTELSVWKAAMPEESSNFEAADGIEAVERYGLSPQVVGCIHGPGGAIHPYRLITNLLSNLLDRHSENFFIATNTPCTQIQPPNKSNPFYTLSTPNGHIMTSHVIHATNGWTSHLLTPMREKIIPARGTMSSQRPGTSLNTTTTLSGYRSYVFLTGSVGYDYLTQLPSGENELMFGGGWASAQDFALTDIGLSDDSTYSLPVASHLAGALPLYFGEKGREKLRLRSVQRLFQRLQCGGGAWFPPLEANLLER